MKTETKIRIYGLTLIAVSTLYFALYVKANDFPDVKVNTYVHSYETDENRFYNGEILLPDYVHADTLQVINADFLNEMIIDNGYNAESDGDIYDLLQEGTVNIEDYQDYITTVTIK